MCWTLLICILILCIRLKTDVLSKIPFLILDFQLQELHGCIVSGSPSPSSDNISLDLGAAIVEDIQLKEQSPLGDDFAPKVYIHTQLIVFDIKIALMQSLYLSLYLAFFFSLWLGEEAVYNY